jgi:hypothetical protein
MKTSIAILTAVGFLVSSMAASAKEGTVGFEGRNDICKDAQGNFLCYDPNGLWPSGTTVCSSWNSTAATCGLGLVTGTIQPKIKKASANQKTG